MISLVPGKGSPVPILRSEFLRHSDLADLDEVREFPVRDFDEAIAKGLERAVMRGLLSTAQGLRVLELAQVYYRPHSLFQILRWHLVLKLAQVCGMQTLVRTILVTWKTFHWQSLDLSTVPCKVVEQLRGGQLSALQCARQARSHAGTQAARCMQSPSCSGPSSAPSGALRPAGPLVCAAGCQGQVRRLALRMRHAGKQGPVLCVQLLVCPGTGSCAAIYEQAMWCSCSASC